MQAIGVRLEEILIDDALCCEDYDAQALDEQRQRILMDEDENEDFLVEGNTSFNWANLHLQLIFPFFLLKASVNPSGRDFPWPLRLAACMLLFEITAFLRDSYRRLPRSTRVSLRSNEANKSGGGNNTGGSLNVASGSFNEQQRGGNPSGGVPSSAIVVSSGESIVHHSVGGGVGGGSGSIALATSVATPASNTAGGRRWSMALSSMGQSQNSAQSLQSITGDGHSIGILNVIFYK